jgi:thiamine pyrophosphokinase
MDKTVMDEQSNFLHLPHGEAGRGPLVGGASFVILADGSFPTHDIPLDILHNAKYLCCCDGAGMELISHGIMPDAIVGDCDSMTEEFKERYKDIIHVVEEQEYNDLTKCTKHVLEIQNSEFKIQNDTSAETMVDKAADRLLPHGEAGRGPTIAYLGCTGKREDHTLGNISLMAFYMEEFGIKPYMFTDYGVFMPAHGTQTFRSTPRLQVSIFNISCEELTSEGLRWNAYPYRQLWQGTLNEATGDSFTIHADGTYIVYVTYEAKT